MTFWSYNIHHPPVLVYEMDTAGPAARCPSYQTLLSHCSILLVFASMAQRNVLHQFNLQLCTSVHLHLIQTLCLTNDNLLSFSEMNFFFHFNPKVKNRTSRYSYISLELHAWQSSYVSVPSCCFDERIIALSAASQREAL